MAMTREKSSVADEYAPTPAGLWRDLYRRHGVFFVADRSFHELFDKCVWSAREETCCLNVLIHTLPHAVWTSALAYMLPFVTVISIVRAGCVLKASVDLLHAVLMGSVVFTPQLDDFPLGQL